MKCINCGKEIPENSKFCMECGKAVEQEATCKNCGQVLPGGAKFCNNCGEKVGEKITGASAKEGKNIPIVIKRKKQMLGGQPIDIYIDDEYVGNLKCGDFVNYNLPASKANAEIKVRIVMLYLFNNSISLYLTLRLNETEPKNIVIVQDFNSNNPDIDLISGLDVISKMQSKVEKYSSPGA